MELCHEQTKKSCHSLCRSAAALSLFYICLLQKLPSRSLEMGVVQGFAITQLRGCVSLGYDMESTQIWAIRYSTALYEEAAEEEEEE